uniref:SCP domain-containing protein n=1 Tax=Caenorhabditis japonica TaxID=281687 RepID=A0A8R1HJQ5_CAEJA
MNAFLPPILLNHEEQRHTITRKRMERFSTGGQLLSVTDVGQVIYIFLGMDRVVPTTIIREYSKNDVPSNQDSEWKTTDSYVRKTSILKSAKRDTGAGTYGTGQPSSQRVEWREPLDCLIDRINRIRSSMTCPPLEPSVRLADISAQWARMLAVRGEFRSDRNRCMNIWMGSRVTESIADIWWDEAEEYGTRNFLDDQSLSWVGVASAFSEQHRQFIVVAVYE